MGIKQLSKVIKDNSKKGIKERSLGFYADKKVCIDASMFIYQFLIAVRSDGASLGTEDNTTSHIVGMFYRTIRLVEAGVTPVYVFDGAPPESKMFELKKRTERREKAEEGFKKAEEGGDKQEMEKFEKRKIKVGKEHVEDCKTLLKLMGIPFITAPSEAEAFCAYLCMKNYADGVATEDMDALTFGAPLVLRNFTASQAKKVPVLEYDLGTILKEMGLSMDEFIDLCILLGCDYSETLKGIGIKRSVGLIKKYRSIEKILEKEDIKEEEIKKFNFEDARAIFKELPFLEAEVSEFKIQWEEIKVEEIKKFLVEEKKFGEQRVTKGVEKLLAARKRPKQGRLDQFFKIVPK
ncbi:Flap endonuclease 1 [Nosema granulosis]|uniref:Flap endonuclease 1 n=1 Tax=Nosema granulosis TaxID=83296 RepID=A0A9P6L007_9MICR|nr:Flap endonuclease 1 [Nosema granulosis]